MDVLKKFLHRQWSSDDEMRAAVDPLLAQIAELAPEETEEAAPGQSAPASSTDAATTETGIAAPEKRRPAPEALPQAKSVRISLERLDRMMNAVGELVINRTRMVGRLAELAKLVEVLNFSKSRLSGKVSEFQEKHEFSRIQPLLVPGSQAPQMDTFRPHFTGMGAVTSNDLLEFSELEMDRYDDFNILSRSLTEISADVNVVLTQLEGFMGRVDSDIDEFTKLAHHLQDEITAARMVPIGNLYTRLTRTVRDAANATGKLVELLSKARTPSSTTILFSTFPIR